MDGFSGTTMATRNEWYRDLELSNTKQTMVNGHKGTVVVMKSTLLSTGETVAVRKGLVNAEEVMRDIVAMRAISSAHVVSMYGVGQHGSLVFIIMEHCTSNLRSTLNSRTPRNDATKRRYAKQIFDGLSATHTLGIVHRGICPVNILVKNDGDLCLSNFSAATMDGMPADRRHKLPDERYRCPEALLGKGGDDFCADIWAAGMVCLDIAGFNGLDGRNFVEQFLLIFELFGTPAVDDWDISKYHMWSRLYPVYPGTVTPTTFPHVLRDVITTALVLNPEKRASAMDLLAMLE